MKKNTSELQADILSNFGNTAYQRISKDIHFDNIPSELYELWYSTDMFSFRQLIDLNKIRYLSNNELTEYHSQVVILYSELKLIFNDIEKKSLIKRAKEVNKNKITLLRKLIKVLEEDINNG